MEDFLQLADGIVGPAGFDPIGQRADDHAISATVFISDGKLRLPSGDWVLRLDGLPHEAAKKIVAVVDAIEISNRDSRPAAEQVVAIDEGRRVSSLDLLETSFAIIEIARRAFAIPHLDQAAGVIEVPPHHALLRRLHLETQNRASGLVILESRTPPSGIDLGHDAILIVVLHPPAQGSTVGLVVRAV